MKHDMDMVRKKEEDGEVVSMTSVLLGLCGSEAKELKFRQQPQCGFVVPDQELDQGMTAQAAAFLVGAIVAHVAVHKGFPLLLVTSAKNPHGSLSSSEAFGRQSPGP